MFGRLCGGLGCRSLRLWGRIRASIGSGLSGGLWRICRSRRLRKLLSLFCALRPSLPSLSHWRRQVFRESIVPEVGVVKAEPVVEVWKYSRRVKVCGVDL